MPIYAYGCEACGFDLEKLQKISDPPLRDCPECGEARLRKKVTAAGFRLKGSGWYETDFKKDNKRNLADSGDGKSESQSADKAGGGSDSKSGGGGDSGGDSGGKSSTAKPADKQKAAAPAASKD